MISALIKKINNAKNAAIPAFFLCAKLAKKSRLSWSKAAVNMFFGKFTTFEKHSLEFSETGQESF